jgi:archaellin
MGTKNAQAIAKKVEEQARRDGRWNDDHLHRDDPRRGSRCICLISTANQVREQAQSTGNDAIGNVATSIMVQDVVGTVAANNITTLNMNVRLAAGSPDIDLDNVVISVNDGTNVKDYSIGGTNAYTVAKVRDSTADADFTANHYIHQGDMIKVTITGLTLAPQTHVVLKIMPAYGQANEVAFTTPETYTGTVIVLK